MISNAHPPKRLALSLLGLLCTLTLGQSAWAQARSEVEQSPATTQALIDTLVENGVISREKADQLMAKSRAQSPVPARALAQLTDTPAPAAPAMAAAPTAAAARPVAAPAPSAPSAPSTPSVAPPVAPGTAAALAEVGPDGKKVVRISYVPESLKREMREQIKEEVLLQARNERWGEPGALPSWMNRFRFEGDFRLREDLVRLAPDNTPPGFAWVNNDLTRAADVALSTGNGLYNFNTQNDFDRTRIRARLGVTAAVSDNVSATMRLSTGSQSERTSTNQTLGQYFNKYQLLLDQAYISLRSSNQQLSFSGGRMPNPFFSTDLVWADDLGFEGVAASARSDLFKNGSAYFTMGYFPLSEDRPGSTSRRSLMGLQSGLDMKLGTSAHHLRLGLALYNFQGIEGNRDTTAAQLTAPDYATRYEYAAGFRQRGNTLFNVRAPGDLGLPIYGLASSFRELNLTATLDLVNVLAQPIRLTGDYVRNLSFNPDEIQARTGVALTDGKDYGFMVKFQIGKNQIAKRGDWNASLAYRYLGSDAVLDAFTNSDFGLGGTNSKGLVLGFNYGIYDNTSLSVRLMSSNPIDSYAPGSVAASEFSTDIIQLELNTRF
jgi:hypothetical protein